MAPGAPTTVATLARRAVGFILDGFVLIPVYVVYAVVLDGLFGALVAPGPEGTGLVVVGVDPPRVAIELALTLVTDAAYYAGCWARWGMTLGQRASGVVVGLAGPAAPPRPGPAAPPRWQPVPAPVATTRWAVLQLLPLCASTLGATGALPLETVAGLNSGWFAFLFLTAALDPLRRGLHDRVAGTIVLHVARRP